MIQEEFKDLVFKFARYASTDEVAYIFLFGSVAKGNADRRSDVDMLVVLDTENPDFEKMEAKITISELALTLEKEFDRNIQVVFTNRKYEGIDAYLIQKVLKEGIVLFSKTPSITINGIEAEPYAIILYELGDISLRDKMRVKRLMYGHKTKKVIKGKTYESKRDGIVQQLQGLRLASGAVAIPQKNIQLIENEFERLKLKYKRVDIWLTKDGLRKMQTSVMHAIKQKKTLKGK
jgi:predicted nucleotidyltransferase